MRRSIAGTIALATLAAAGGALLADGGAAAETPRAELVFAHRGEIYTRSADGRTRRLTKNRVLDSNPSWSPDRKKIVFVRWRAGNDGDLWVMDADGSGARRLAGNAPRATDSYPRFSPDGEWIAFSSERGGRQPELYVMRADGTKVRRLTRTPRHVENVQPSFSPDGRYLVFASNRVAYWNFEIFRIRAADGGGVKRLTFWGSGGDGEPGDDISPSYSPDGKRIAFVSDRNGGYAVWTMDARGRRLREVVRERGYAFLFPRFSRDGRSLVVTALHNDPDGPFTERLWTVRADGTRRVDLAPGTAADW